MRETITCYNVVGELPGADDETVIIGSHHDGPWSSAVEDGSGIALVLAQAAYWSRLPRAERPHRLLFLLNAGHMAGGAGTRASSTRTARELDRVVLEVHLEHTANEFVEHDGALQPTGHPEARWWFTSRVARLRSGRPRSASRPNDLHRSLILPPDAFGPHPTTDGGPLPPRRRAAGELPDRALLSVRRAWTRWTRSTAQPGAGDARGDPHHRIDGGRFGGGDASRARIPSPRRLTKAYKAGAIRRCVFVFLW